MVQTKRIVFSHRGGIGTLTIDRAEKANALTAAMMLELAEHIHTVAQDASLKALVLTGAGQRAFCAGVDIRDSAGLPPDEAAKVRSERLFALLITLAECPKPVIVGMNGVAAGAGAMLALLGDRLMAVEHAALAFPEIDLGTPTFAGLAILAHLCGGALTCDLVQSARRMSAAEALGRGLCAELTKPEALTARVEEAALALGSKPAQAFALNKQWLRRALIGALRSAQEDTRHLRESGLIP